MANVKFYRGVRAKYDYVVDGGVASGKHVDGLYYATDTHEVLMNGVSYGNVADLRLQKATSGEGTQANPYVWANASTLYWGGHYRFATSDGVLAFEFDTPSAKSDGYLTFDSNGTNLDINSSKIADGDTSTTGHDKLATKGYVDNQIAGLSNAIVSVAGNGGASGAAGGTTVTLSNTSGTTYSGKIYFNEKDGGSQPIDIQFDAADFVKDSYLTGVTYYQTEPTGDDAPAGHAGVSYPALYFKFKTTGGASNFWVSLNNLVDNYTGSDTIDITNRVISAKVAANGGLQAVTNEGLAVKTADASLTTNAAGLAVKTATNKGLETATNTSGQTDGGLAVKLEADGGIAFDSTNGGLEIKPKTNSGIEVTTDGVAVKTGAGLQTDANGVSVKLHQTSNTDDSGLTATSADGLTVNTAGYVTKSNNAVALDTSKIEGYNASASVAADNNLASKKYVDSQLATGLEWNEVN